MEEKMKIAIGNDHAATELKFVIMETILKELGHEVINFGTDGTDSCNYPEDGEKVGRAVVAGEADCGVLICGTGVGISIAANKVNGVRAAVCSDTATARLVKRTQQCQHYCIRCQNRRHRACERHRQGISGCKNPRAEDTRPESI